jgi:hypothetical protein
LQFDRPFRLVSKAARDAYAIYAFDEPLQPGESLLMTFSIAFESHGFRDGNEQPQFAANGTFFDQEFFPEIGYDAVSNWTIRGGAVNKDWGRRARWRRAAIRCARA